MFTDHYKRFGFLKFWAPFGNTAHVASLWEKGSGSHHRNADPLAPTVAKCHKLSFVSDPGILYLLLASMKLWQAHLLICK